MKLLTKKLESQLPALYDQEKKGDNAIAYVKYFTPDANLHWYATEYDPKDKLFFGLVIGFEPELGYFSLEELESCRGPMGLPIERDYFFKPQTLKQIRREYYDSKITVIHAIDRRN
jgi:hypothetical protein